jgi:hypothetical protein
MSGVSNNYYINGVNTYGIGTSTAQINEQGLSLTTITDNFSMNGLGFLYNGLGATWNDVRQKVEDLKAVVAPPDITTLTVNNKIQVSNGVSTTTINPASVVSTTFTGSLNGTANFASTTVVASDSSTTTYPTFVLGTSGNQAQKINTNLTYNAFTNTLNVANLNGNSATSTTTNNVNNAGVVSGGPYGVAYMNNSAGTTFISSDTAGSHLTFNPSSNTLSTRNLTITGSTTAISAPNATAISAPNANITATTFTGALNGNANTANSATTASNLNALNPITPYYLYPIASPANIGWTQVITTTGWTFNNITKAYACNTTPLVAGIYIIRAYVYCGNSSFYSGTQIINLVASNSFITNNSTSGFIDPSNAGPMGYMYSRIPYNTGDSVNNAPFVVNNTGAGFYPYWAIAVNNSVQISPAGNGVPQMNFCRIA